MKKFLLNITYKSTDKIGLRIGENAAEITRFSVAVVNGLTKKQLDKIIGYIHQVLKSCYFKIKSIKFEF